MKHYTYKSMNKSLVLHGYGPGKFVDAILVITNYRSRSPTN